MEIIFRPVATVRNSRQAPLDDRWGSIVSEIVLDEDVPTGALHGIGDFSHLEIVYLFDRAEPSDIVYQARPRGNPRYPLTGIFAQRKKDRPNLIGVCTVKLVAHHDRSVTVENLDAIDGTPVLDIKPVFREFQPAGPIRQPAWVSDLMRDYW